MRGSDPPKETLADLLFETWWGIEGLLLVGAILAFLTITTSTWFLIGVALAVVLLVVLLIRRYNHQD